METNKPIFQIIPRTSLDQLIFIITIISGIVITLIVKGTNLHPFVIAVSPSAVILLYAVFISFYSSATLEPEMIGDNCYYLGFIFTLVSLAYTLYAVSTNSNDLDLVRQIISGFGLALATTITGIFLRTFFLQLRPDVVTAELKARDEIIKATTEFRTQLTVSSKGLKKFSTEVIQLLKEFHTQHLEASKIDLDKSRRVLEETRDNLVVLSNNAVKDLKNIYEGGASELKITTEESLKSLGDHARKVSQDSANIYEEGIRGLKSTISDTTKSLEKEIVGVASKSVEAVSGIAKAASKVSDEISQISTVLDVGIKQISSSISHSTNTFANATDNLSNAFRISGSKIIESSNIAADNISEASDNLGRLAYALGDTYERTVGLMKKLHGLFELIDILQKKLTYLKSLPEKEDIVDIKNTMIDLLNQLNMSADSLKNVTLGLDKSFSDSSIFFGKLAEIIVQIDVLFDHANKDHFHTESSGLSGLKRFINKFKK